jgi:hypothetical protein
MGNERSKVEETGYLGTALALAPDGGALACACQDRRVIFWKTAPLVKDRHRQLPGTVNALASTTDGRHRVTGNSNGTFYVLHLARSPSEGGH